MSLRCNKRGLSTIVATLIIILLVLVSAGIIWVVVRNLIQGNAEQIDLGKLTLDLSIEKIQFSGNDVGVTVKRNQGEGEFIGISFVFEDGQNSEVFTEYVSMNELEVRTFTFTLEDINPEDITKIKIYPILKLKSGKEVDGDIKDTWESGSSGVSQCNPNCIGKVCGSDGCLGSCGSLNGNCPPGESCNAFGTCVPENTCIETCDLLEYECGSVCEEYCGSCSNFHGTTSCITGNCQPVCDANYSSCDLNAANGCETQLGTTTDCASCGNTCSTGQTCTLGVCLTPCTDECTPLGSTQCSGANIQTCVTNYDADSCREWNAPTACPSGQTCSGNVCVSGCTDECTPLGSTQCSGANIQTCVTNYDADSCREWNAPTACTPTGYTCVGNVCTAPTGTCGGSACKTGEYCFNNQVCLLTVPGNTYFVATNGNDNNLGTYSQPWKTWQKAVQVSQPGDITYIRGGVWQPTTYIGASSSIGMSIIGSSGTAQAPIRYYNYPGERPILDGSLMGPNEYGWINGIGMSNVEYIYFKGLTVSHIHQRPPDPTKEKIYSEAYGIGCSNCANMYYENMVSHDIDGRGFYHWGGAWNTWDGPDSPFASDSTSWINCDAYNLYDLYAQQPGNAADGWKVHGYSGNHFYWEGCRAFNYSDDGFDPSGQSYRTFKNCWAMSTHKYEGLSGSWIEGNGIKTTAIDLIYYPDYFLTQKNLVTFENTIVADCAGVGFMNNLYAGGGGYWPYSGLIYNSLSYKNKIGFIDSNSSTYRNNIVLDSTSLGPTDEPYDLLITAVYPESHNTWDAYNPSPGSWPWAVPASDMTVTDGDFISLDASQLMTPRKADFSLPTNITFAHLVLGSDLIDAGMIIPGYHCTTAGAHPGENCREWYGSAPDVGPFESNY